MRNFKNFGDFIWTQDTFKNMHKNIRSKQEPCNVSFLYTPIHVLDVHCKVEIFNSKSPSAYKSANIRLLLHKKIHTLLLTQC